MAESGLKRFWNTIKLPPAAGRRENEMALPPEEQRRRNQLLTVTAAVFLIGGGSWAAYLYVASAPRRAEAVFHEGMSLMALGKDREAVERFTKATDIWPDLANGYLERGLVRLNLHQTDQAIQDFEQAIDVTPSLAEAHTALGSIYRQQGDLKRAVNEFSLAIDLGSAVDANYQRGQMYESLGEHQKALDDYNQAVHGLPDAPYIYRARAVAKEKLGDATGAQEDRKKADSIEFPNAPKAAP
jgi:tetratricopeptide (TPR) repeat protein